MEYNNFVIIIEEDTLAKELELLLTQLLPHAAVVTLRSLDTEIIYNSKLIITNKKNFLRGDDKMVEHFPPIMYVLDKDTYNTSYDFRFKDEMIFQPVRKEEFDFRLNRLLKRSTKMNRFEEECNSNISTEELNILGSINHEIRTPLNAILGFAEHLKQNIKSSEELSNSVDGIILGGNELLNLLNKLLDISKLKSGHIHLEKQLISPKRLLNEIRISIKKKTLKSDTVCKIHANKNLPKWIVADGDLIKQIIINLLKNAIKHTVKGAITLTLGSENWDENNQKVDLFIKIKDTGTGISIAKQKELFAPLEINDKLSRQNIDSLELPLIKKIVEIMGGNISLISKQGKGTYIKIAFRKLPIYNIDLTQATNNNATASNTNMVDENTFEVSHIANRIFQAAQNNKQTVERVRGDIDTNISPLFTNAAKSMFFEDLKLFADAIVNTGNKYHITPMVEYGRYIEKMMELYNIEIIPDLLMEFPKIKNKLNNI